MSLKYTSYDLDSSKTLGWEGEVRRWWQEAQMKDGNRFPTSSILQWDCIENVYRNQEKEIEIQKKGKCWDKKGAHMIGGGKFV